MGANFEVDLMRVQSLRSSPPGLVSTRTHRQRVFGAGLHQFDGLARASGQVDPFIAPILLYYALAQAGQAVAAARIPGNSWRPTGHGLEIAYPSDVLGEVRVAPQPSERSSFRLFCRATGSEHLTKPVALGELWAAVPLLTRVPGLGEEHAAALTLSTRGTDRVYLTGPIVEGLTGANEDARSALKLRLKSPYPMAVDGLEVEEFGSIWHGEPDAALVSWQDGSGQRRPVEELAPPLLGAGGGAVLSPSLTSGDVLSPIAAWWATLLALSSVARYRPDLWRSSLDRDASPVAVAVEDGLAATRELLPIIVMSALTGQGWKR